MRNIIIGLSLIFFVLSGIVLFKALNIPVNQTKQQNNPEELKTNLPAAEAEDASGKYPLDQAAGQSAVHDSQAASAMSGGDGANRNAGTQTNDKTSGNSNKARVLAVIGAGAFNTGQIVIDNSLMHTIKEVVPHIQSSPDYRVYVEGHTDDMPIKVSSDKRFIDNMELSYLRAKAVASILEENGISIDRISITGYGDTRPVTSNETDEGRIKNRRVEIKLMPKG
jgi:flagellar motor protein MotB